MLFPQAGRLRDISYGQMVCLFRNSRPQTVDRRRGFLLRLRLLLCNAVDVSTAVSNFCCLHAYDLAVRIDLLHLFYCKFVIFIAVLRQDDSSVYDQVVQIRSDRNLAFLTRDRTF